MRIALLSGSDRTHLRVTDRLAPDDAVVCAATAGELVALCERGVVDAVCIDMHHAAARECVEAVATAAGLARIPVLTILRSTEQQADIDYGRAHGVHQFIPAVILLAGPDFRSTVDRTIRRYGGHSNGGETPKE